MPVGAALFDWVSGVGVILSSALLWLLYYRWKDRNPEPAGLVLGAFLLGAVSVGIALLGYHLAFELGAIRVYEWKDPAQCALCCFLVVGPVEEGAKFLVTWLGPYRSKEFDEEIDGLVYSSAVALGFASVENVLYLPWLSWDVRLLRAIAMPLSHSLFSSLWGFGLAHAKFRARSPGAKAFAILSTLALGAAAHGLYDFAILAHGQTLAAGLLVFALWFVMATRARSAVEALDVLVHPRREDS
jgi:RsiW-degrading membrane proteinase PrsW (M82 family)